MHPSVQPSRSITSSEPSSLNSILYSESQTTVVCSCSFSGSVTNFQFVFAKKHLPLSQSPFMTTYQTCTLHSCTNCPLWADPASSDTGERLRLNIRVYRDWDGRIHSRSCPFSHPVHPGTLTELGTKLMLGSTSISPFQDLGYDCHNENSVSSFHVRFHFFDFWPKLFSQCIPSLSFLFPTPPYSKRLLSEPKIEEVPHVFSLQPEYWQP